MSDTAKPEETEEVVTKCVICGQRISSTKDSGVSQSTGNRYHLECLRREAGLPEGDPDPENERRRTERQEQAERADKERKTAKQRQQEEREQQQQEESERSQRDRRSAKDEEDDEETARKRTARQH
jgi:hypothetical protein